MAELAQYESSIRNLEQILEQINQQDTSLDESIELYAKAASLLVECRQGLETARVRIEEIDLFLASASQEREET